MSFVYRLYTDIVVTIPRRRLVLYLCLVVCLVMVLRLTLVENNGNKHTRREESWTSQSQSSVSLIHKISKEFERKDPLSSVNLKSPQLTDFSQNGQSCYIAALFADKVNSGTFLEAGAYDGEELSNSLFLERELGWSGVLVEPDPWNYWSLRKRNRNARSLNACLSPNRSASRLVFKQSDTMGRISSPEERKNGRGIFTEVNCYPLYSVLRAANLTELDYLALDLEGLEMQVLETIPWEKVDIKVLQIEASHLDKTDEKRKTKAQAQRPMIGRDEQVKEILDRNLQEEKERGSCEYKKQSEGIMKLTEAQTKLQEYLMRLGYDLLEQIGEDLIFAKADFIQK